MQNIDGIVLSKSLYTWFLYTLQLHDIDFSKKVSSSTSNKKSFRPTVCFV